jgi:hypothetical protein
MRQVRQENYRVEDELSNFEQTKVQKKLVNEAKIEAVENPRFMMEARQKELEQKQRQEEKRNFPIIITGANVKPPPPQSSSLR